MCVAKARGNVDVVQYVLVEVTDGVILPPPLVDPSLGNASHRAGGHIISLDALQCTWDEVIEARR